MRAVVLDGPGPAEALVIRNVEPPVPQAGWVGIGIRAFGLNRSELHTRLGLADGVTFPRVPGIEATGVVVDCPGGEFEIGQQVATMMGGMGRTFDGGYADYTSVPARNVIAFRSDLDWATIGAVPEMLQTAHGSLRIGLGVVRGASLLIRGGTSSVGVAAAMLAKADDMTVISTTRDESKAGELHAIGVDHVVVDTGDIASQVRAIAPDGVDFALELVGTPTLADTLAATRVHGVVCFAGMLSNVWTIDGFYPIEHIPRGVRLTSYVGEASDLPAPVLQKFLDDIASGAITAPIRQTYRFDEIADAHRHMESGRGVGKIVVAIGTQR